MYAKQLPAVARQCGMTVLAPLLLLLTAAIVVVHASSERGIRVQRQQSAQRAIAMVHTQSKNTLQHILGALRTATPQSVTERLAFANAAVASHTQSLGSGRRVIAYRVSFDAGAALGLPSHRFHFDAVAYPMLHALPEAGYVSTTDFPADGRLTVWGESAQPSILTTVEAGTQAGQIRYCPVNEPAPCPGIAVAQLSPPAADVFLSLFNRTAQAIAADDFIGAIERRDCGNIRLSAPSVVWVQGECQLSVNQSLGDADNPALLFVENGDLRLPAGSQITGMVVLLQRGTALPASVVTAANAQVVGALVNTARLNNNLRLNLIADPRVLETLQRSAALSKVALIPGSWRDYE